MKTHYTLDSSLHVCCTILFSVSLYMYRIDQPLYIRQLEQAAVTAKDLAEKQAAGKHTCVWVQGTLSPAPFARTRI